MNSKILIDFKIDCKYLNIFNSLLALVLRFYFFIKIKFVDNFHSSFFEKIIFKNKFCNLVYYQSPF